MRYVRYAFYGALGVVLFSLALANRQAVDLRLLPEPLAEVLNFQFEISLPLFLVILGGIVVGIVAGYGLEWMREHKHRSGRSRAERELQQTRREVRRLKGKQSEGKDEVLALLDEAG